MNTLISAHAIQPARPDSLHSAVEAEGYGGPVIHQGSVHPPLLLLSSTSSLVISPIPPHSIKKPPQFRTFHQNFSAKGTRSNEPQDFTSIPSWRS